MQFKKISKTFILILLAVFLTFPLWLEVFHHHTDMNPHVDCPLCHMVSVANINLNNIADVFTQSVAYIPLKKVTILVTFSDPPLYYSPSNSPPSV